MAVAKTFTPELMANGRYRYEQTDEPVTSIAADFRVAERTFNKYVHKWGWTPRSERPPHGLSALESLLQQSKEIPAVEAQAEIAAATPADDNTDEGIENPQASPLAISLDERAAVVERMWRAVQEELAAVERMRAQRGTQPQRPVDAEKTARTLESIMRTLREVDRLRFAVASPAATDDDDYDDMPRDLDECSRELARRIDAFVANRTDEGLPEHAADGEGVEPARS